MPKRGTTIEAGDEAGDNELPPAAYLRDLAARINRIPVMYGTDQYDVERLEEIAANLEPEKRSP